jgi:hypothetical protein
MKACSILSLVLLIAVAVSVRADPVTEHDVKIFNGAKRLFASIGPSTSQGIAPILQRKFCRYTGYTGARSNDCPLQVKNYSTPGGRWRMPGWIDCKPSANDSNKWEAIRSEKYLGTVKKLVDDNPGTPVIIISMNCTGYATIPTSVTVPGKNRIRSPEDIEHINLAVAFLRTHIKAALDDGVAMYFLSPKKYWRALDDPNEWNRNEETYAVTKVAAEHIPGFVYVKGVWEDTAKYKEIALQKDGHHPTKFGSEIIASKFFRAMLEHDGLPVPAWDQEEVDSARNAMAGNAVVGKNK